MSTCQFTPAETSVAQYCFHNWGPFTTDMGSATTLSCKHSLALYSFIYRKMIKKASLKTGPWFWTSQLPKVWQYISILYETTSTQALFNPQNRQTCWYELSNTDTGPGGKLLTGLKWKQINYWQNSVRTKNYWSLAVVSPMKTYSFHL